jgi:leucyl aminopeptidase (aminopeptidase T)
VVVTCLVEHAPVARAVAREAYRAGAQHVVFIREQPAVDEQAPYLGEVALVDGTLP